MIKKFFMSILLLTIITSCTNDADLFDVANEGNVGRDVKIHFGVKPLGEGAETRAYFGSTNRNDGKSTSFVVDAGDEFGIYCVDTKRCLQVTVSEMFIPKNGIPTETFGETFDFEGSVPEDFIVDGYKYIIYYPYSSVSRDELYAYLSYGCQVLGNVEEESNYYFSAPFEFENGEPSTNITLKSISAAIRLNLSCIWGTIEYIDLVNVDAQGKFYANIPCVFTSNGVVPNLENAHKVRQISLSINKYVYYSDENHFVITSYPTTTGDFVLRLTMAEGDKTKGKNILYSDVISSKTLKADRWTNINCNNWTSTRPEFQYDYLDINTGEYHKNP